MIWCVITFIQSTIILPIITLPLTIFQKNIFDKCSEIILYEILQIKHIIHYKHPLIKKGFVLANHRSFLDFAIDPYLARASVMGRILAFLSVSFLWIIGMLEGRVIPFWRGRVTSHSLFSRCKVCFKHTDRILFYPEGTRRGYKELWSTMEVREMFRYGLLKRIYEEKRYPVQIILSNNKENVFNEKKFYVNKGLCVKSIICEPIYPFDYENFDDFIEAIAEQWLYYWNAISDFNIQ